MSGWVSGWRLALRIAAREALRAKARSAVVVVMILLPVLGVATADILLRTNQLSDVEAVPRSMGAAQARIEMVGGTVRQYSVDPFNGSASWDATHAGVSLASLFAVIGKRPVVPWDRSYLSTDLPGGQGILDVDLTDPRNPLTDGMYRLERGRWPAAKDEIVVTPYLASHGPGIGQMLTVETTTGPVPMRVVGIADSEQKARTDLAIALPGSLPLDGQYVDGRGYLVGGAPIGLTDLLRLNAAGAMVFSRAVAADPPDLSAYAPVSRFDAIELSIIGLMVVMGLLEVVLLAGPALAVGAKRQSRSLALLASAGGTPAQVRRVVLANGIVTGGMGAVVGMMLAIPAARLLEPALQRVGTDRIGPFDLRWQEILIVALFGAASALAAAVVPAWIASRQDVVAVLTGRRGDRRPSLRSPALGVVLLLAGVGCAVAAAHDQTDLGALLLCASALLCALGMVLLVGIVVSGLARISARLPLPLRLTIRDADRHRTRMVPAVAAVAGTVMGLTAVGVAFASYQAKQVAEYQPFAPIGVGQVYGDGATPDDWAATADFLGQRLPAATIGRESAVVPAGRGGTVAASVTLGGARTVEPSEFRGAPRSDVVVSDDLNTLPDGMSRDLRDEAASALASGGAVVYTETPRPPATATVQVVTVHGRERIPMGSADVPVVFVVPGSMPDGTMTLSTGLAARLGLSTHIVHLAVSGVELDRSTVSDLNRELKSMPGAPSMEVDQGYQWPTYVRIIELILLALGGFLMIGGTVTSTYLSVADARPDLATLAAVGATPLIGRLVAAAYALVVAVVGAVLGAVIGMVPGIAVVYDVNSDFVAREHQAFYVTVPWGPLALVVVGLPLGTALLVGLVTRSRLPMVARLG